MVPPAERKNLQTIKSEIKVDEDEANEVKEGRRTGADFLSFHHIGSKSDSNYYDLPQGEHIMQKRSAEIKKSTKKVHKKGNMEIEFFARGPIAHQYPSASNIGRGEKPDHTLEGMKGSLEKGDKIELDGPCEEVEDATKKRLWFMKNFPKRLAEALKILDEERHGDAMYVVNGDIQDMSALDMLERVFQQLYHKNLQAKQTEVTGIISHLSGEEYPCKNPSILDSKLHALRQQLIEAEAFAIALQATSEGWHHRVGNGFKPSQEPLDFGYVLERINSLILAFKNELIELTQDFDCKLDAPIIKPKGLNANPQLKKPEDKEAQVEALLEEARKLEAEGNAEKVN